MVMILLKCNMFLACSYILFTSLWSLLNIEPIREPAGQHMMITYDEYVHTTIAWRYGLHNNFYTVEQRTSEY